jgi:elongator complex protein 6
LFGVISHIQGTSPGWLVNILVENALFGTCVINHDNSQAKIPKADVVLISFLQDFKFYERDLKRNGVEVKDLKNFHFIDCFTDLFNKIGDVASIDKLFTQISAQVSHIHSNSKVIIIEGIEFLLSATNITSIQLLNQINKLHKLSSSLLIVSAVDKELIDTQGYADKSTPEFKTLDFLIRLLHRAQLNVSLRPLETGRANDITGTLTISKGTIPYESLPILETEYLFHVSKDQNTKLFYR